MSNETNNTDSRYEKRRKRHARNRRISVILLLTFLIVLGIGIYFLVTSVDFNEIKTKIFHKNNVEETTSVSVDVSTQESEMLEKTLEELLGDEEEIVVPEETPSPSPTPEAVDEEAMLEQRVNKKISEMSLEQKVAGLFIISPEQLTGVETVTLAGDGTKASLEKKPVGGLIYDAKNIENDKQFAEMISNTSEYVTTETFLILREGFGDKAVYSQAAGVSQTRNARDIGFTINPYEAFTEAEIVASYLKQLKINMSIAVNNRTIPEDAAEDEYTDRFSTDKDLCDKMAVHAVSAYEEIGVNVAMGMFTDCEASNEDDYRKIDNLSMDDITNGVLQGYVDAASEGLDAIIVGHGYAPNLSDGSLPASLTKEILTNVIRMELGLDDIIVITDAMNVEDITSYYSSGEAAVRALKSGADMIMLPEDYEEAFDEVIAAVETGVISEERIDESLRRIYRVKMCEMTEDLPLAESEDSK